MAHQPLITGIDLMNAYDSKVIGNHKLKRKNKRLRSEIDQLKTNINGLKRNINALNSNIHGLKRNISILEGIRIKMSGINYEQKEQIKELEEDKQKLLKSNKKNNEIWWEMCVEEMSKKQDLEERYTKLIEKYQCEDELNEPPRKRQRRNSY